MPVSHGEPLFCKRVIMGKKARRIAIKEEYCIGCRICEVFCITRHSKSGDIIKVYKGSEPRPVSGIYFEEKGSLSFAIQCRHCDDAPCIENCPAGAMYRDEKTGQVLHNSERCVGCWMCVMACPLGVIKIDYTEKRVVSKCDLCIEEGFPACVEHCPNEAIYLIDEDGKKVDR
jgi:anaerobic carbon-monoxide dehydrogenase iron sulfur subunit